VKTHPSSDVKGSEDLVRPLWRLGARQRYREVDRHLAHKALPNQAQKARQRHLAAVALVDAQPVELDAVLVQPQPLLEGDLPLGVLAPVVGDARLLATVAV